MLAAEIRHRMTDADYSAAPGVRASDLNAFGRSPAYCLLRRNEPLNQTAALRIGSAVHRALFDIGGFAAMLANKELKPEEFDKAKAMAASLLANPEFRERFEQAAGVEAGIFWERNGVACKAKPDIYGPRWIMDVKTTRDLARFSPWSITDYGYHRQAGWYSAGYEQVPYVPVLAFYFAAVQSQPPYETCVFRLHPDSLAAGRADAEALFAALVECEKSGEWPAHYPGVKVAHAAWSEVRG